MGRAREPAARHGSLGPSWGSAGLIPVIQTRAAQGGGSARGEARKRCPHPASAPAPGFVRPSRPRGGWAHGVFTWGAPLWRSRGSPSAGPTRHRAGVGAPRAGQVARRGEPRLTGAQRGAGAPGAPWRKAGARAALQCHQRNGFHMSGPTKKGGEGREFWAGQDERMRSGGCSMEGAEQRQGGKTGRDWRCQEGLHFLIFPEFLKTAGRNFLSRFPFLS